MGILDYGLAKVADLIIKYVITPAVSRTLPVSFVEEVNQDAKGMTEAILRTVPSVDSKVNIITILCRFLAACEDMCLGLLRWI